MKAPQIKDTPVGIKKNNLPQKYAIDFDRKSFIIKGRREILIGGEFHYFRTPCALWEDRLTKMKRSGANLVSSYVPWNWHEPVEGVQLWEDDRDVRRFLQLCLEKDLFVILKPGPYCCAELDFGGHPDWLIGKNIPLRRLDDRYLSFAEKWYQSVAKVISPFLITNGGSIVCVQVENEYDHLLWYGDDKISIEEAITYFKKLEQMLTHFGIDVPKFANEAEFLRGSGIIDSRTYYPNIPTFTDWMWEFEHYDDKIAAARQQQPDCPTMIMELQKGWFGAHGHSNYFPELSHTQSVAKSVLMQGASVLNFYLFTGGSTFPFWGCRGDEWAADRWGSISTFNPVGCGVTTSFDFGGSFIREWGDLLVPGYRWIKAFNLFVHDFKDFMLNSVETDDIQAVLVDDEIQVMYDNPHKPEIPSGTIEKFSTLTKKLNDQYLCCVRNLGSDDRLVKILWKKTNRTIINPLKVKSHETLLLPIGVQVPGTDILIHHSTSEFLFARKWQGRMVIGFYGKKGRKGRIALNRDCFPILGRIKSNKIGNQTVLNFYHDSIQIMGVDEHLLFIFDEESAGSIDFLQDTLLVSDAHFIREIIEQNHDIRIKVEVKSDSINQFIYIGATPLSGVNKDRINIPVQYDHNPKLQTATFSFRQPTEKWVDFHWMGNWRIKSDNAEICPDFEDGDWLQVDGPPTLESINFIEHGYVWFRTQFNLPQTFDDTTLNFVGNNIDRQFIFVNGILIKRGRIDHAEIKIQNVVRPGENQVVILYQNFYHTKSHPHEGPLIKYSGPLAPIRIRWRNGQSYSGELITRFKIRQQLNGILKGYNKSYYDDSGWQEIKPSRKYVMHPDVGPILWLRRRFNVQKAEGSQVALNLYIPEAQFRCFIYINGQAAGWYESIGPQRDFYIPESFLKAENVLAMILEGPNGFLQEPILKTFYETKEVELSLFR